MTGSVERGARRRKGEIAFAILLFVFSLFFIWHATLIPEPPRNIVVGPRTMPLLLGALMLLVSSFLVWRELRPSTAPAASVDDAADSESEVVPLEEEGTSIRDWLAVAIVLASLLALFVLLERLGFVLALWIFISGLSTFFSPTRWKMNIIVSLAFCVSFYLLFTRVLGIALPNGLLASLL